MSSQRNLLQLQFDGDAIGRGRLPVEHLLQFLGNLNKAFQRTGRVLRGDAASIQRGQPPQEIKSEVELDLVLLTHGSPSAVLGLERRQQTPAFPQLDFGLEIMEKSLRGLEAVQSEQSPTELPAGYDAGVLMAWRDAGALLNKGVDRIRLTLNRNGKQIDVAITPAGFRRLQGRIQGPQANVRTIEGRLLMADFKEHGTRCRVHPSVGPPVLCLFDEEQRDEVFDDILQYVRVVGEARQDPVTGRITSIKIHDIERLEERQDEALDLLPQGTPISSSFWESPSLDELAAAQGVGPMVDVRALFGTWPGDVNDGFEAAIDELRHGVSGKAER